MERELSPSDIIRITGPVNILTIFNRDQSLNELLQRSRFRNTGKEFFIIHYATDYTGSSLKGHWVAMVVNHRTKKIYWYDSYGIFPDNQTQYINEDFRRESDQDQRYYGRFLYRMVKELRYVVDYNNEQVQQLRPGINTCGRYVSLFLRMNRNNDVTPSQFNSYLKGNINRNNSTLDHVIVSLTRNIR